MHWMRAVSTDAWVGMVFLEAAFFGPLGAALSLVARHRWWPLWMPSFWVAVEWWRAHYPFGGMPWGRLSFLAADTPWLPLLPYLGLDGVSWLVAAVASGLVAVAAFAKPRWGAVSSRWGAGKAFPIPPKRWVAGLVVVMAVVAPTLANIFPFTTSVGRQINVGIVQGSVPGNGTDVLLDHPQVTKNHRLESERLNQAINTGAMPAPDFVVWPENATAVDPFAEAAIRSEIEQSVDILALPILVGAIVNSPNPDAVLNQGIVWSPDTGAGERYTKWHPVPFGEYIPFRGWRLLDGFAQLDQIPRDMAKGSRSTPLAIGGAKVADAICFDIGFDDALPAQIRNGAELVVVQTSNAKFLYTSQQEQQYAITRVQAALTHRWVAVASMNGVTGVIDPSGTSVAELPVKEAGHLVQEVELVNVITPGVRLAWWPAMFSFLLGAVGIAFGLKPYGFRWESERGVDRDRVGAPSIHLDPVSVKRTESP
jgi:apolipoprotein N-acyltransferase